jgi:hypothetical protein
MCESQFQERSQLFIHSHNETFSVIAVGATNNACNE